MKPVLLVVDDEREVLRLVEELLAQSGYEILVANSAEKALRLMETAERRPNILLTDVVMPGMSGPMLADRLRAMQPTLRIVFMSGYDHSHVVQRYVVQQGFRLIAKPFSAEELRGALEDAMQESKSA